jgi:hypothetical protein
MFLYSGVLETCKSVSNLTVIFNRHSTFSLVHPIAQVVSHWLSIAMAWIQFQTKSCGIYVEDFLRVLQFPLPILIQPADSFAFSDLFQFKTTFQKVNNLDIQYNSWD